MGEHSVISGPKLAAGWSAQQRRRPLSPVFSGGLLSAFVLIPALYPQQILPVLLFALSGLVVLMALLRLLCLGLILYPKSSANPKGRTAHSRVKWPDFTVLVPLYQEAHMVPALLRALARLDYPQAHLRIVLVCEADDRPTCAAVKARLTAPFEICEVPPSHPRTKPKALNAALFSRPAHRRGDIITVYDAEDRPHPDQLKQAARALMSDPGLLAVQAPLGYYNDKDTLLSALFGLEYAALFHVFNPALARLGLPFTLGGTSNHIRYQALEQAGGWDAYNVTEDADLSFRLTALSQQGKPNTKIGTISAPTYEEAVSRLPAWRMQRSRWLKGFMQTWHVHVRKQAKSPDGGAFGWGVYLKNLLALQITVGATLAAAFLHLPSLIILSGIALGETLGLIHFAWPPFALMIMFGGYGAAMLMGMVGALKAQKSYLVKFVPLMPFYWLLFFRPAVRAASEFSHAPSLWHKTVHKGLTQHADAVTGKTHLEPDISPPI